MLQIPISFVVVPLYQAAYPQYNAYLIYQYWMLAQIMIVSLPTFLIFVGNLFLWLEHFIVAPWSDWRYKKKKEAEEMTKDPLPPEPVIVTEPSPVIPGTPATSEPQAATVDDIFG